MRDQTTLMYFQKQQAEIDRLIAEVYACRLSLAVLVETLKHANLISSTALQDTIDRAKAQREAPPPEPTPAPPVDTAPAS